MYLFVPYDDSQPTCVVGCSHRDLQRNQIAIISLDPSSASTGKPRGILVRLLGPVGDYDAERTALLYHYCPNAMKKADSENPMDLTGPKEEPIARIVLSAETGWHVFHVDPPSCRDIDDAMAFHPEKGWAITIADAAAAVLPGTLLDIRAQTIGATFYDTEGRVIYPMLPSSISEDTASLLPGRTRKGITLMVNSGEFVASLITVAESYTYESIEGHPLLEGEEPHAWVEKAMIRYNTAVARLLHKTSTGILRMQSPGDAADIAHWESIDPMLLFLAMESASYVCTDPSVDQSHASLGLNAYCHASSPLRRYADLINQRCLHSILGLTNTESNQGYSDIPTHLNKRMKENRRFSRDLLFLEKVVPGRIHHIQVMWLSNTTVWVPEWKRILRIRHIPTEKGSHIAIFCDPTKRNWKQRILTAEP